MDDINGIDIFVMNPLVVIFFYKMQMYDLIKIQDFENINLWHEAISNV